MSVHLSQEEASAVRERRQRGQEAEEQEQETPDTLGTPAPPLPPKPKQKISMIGLPNAEHFIVMDNSAMFSRTASSGKLECSTLSSSSTLKRTLRKSGPALSTFSIADAALDRLQKVTNPKFFFRSLALQKVDSIHYI